MRTVPFFLTAALTSIAIAAATPATAAPSGPPCHPAGTGATVCQTAGHIRVSATPTVKSPPAHQFNGWIGMVHHP